MLVGGDRCIYTEVRGIKGNPDMPQSTHIAFPAPPGVSTTQRRRDQFSSQ